MHTVELEVVEVFDFVESGFLWKISFSYILLFLHPVYNAIIIIILYLTIPLSAKQITMKKSCVLRGDR